MAEYPVWSPRRGTIGDDRLLWPTNRRIKFGTAHNPPTRTDVLGGANLNQALDEINRLSLIQSLPPLAGFDPAVAPLSSYWQSIADRVFILTGKSVPYTGVIDHTLIKNIRLALTQQTDSESENIAFGETHSYLRYPRILSPNAQSGQKYVWYPTGPALEAGHSVLSRIGVDYFIYPFAYRTWYFFTTQTRTFYIRFRGNTFYDPGNIVGADLALYLCPGFYLTAWPTGWAEFFFDYGFGSWLFTIPKPGASYPPTLSAFETGWFECPVGMPFAIGVKATNIYADGSYYSDDISYGNEIDYVGGDPLAYSKFNIFEAEVTLR